MRLNPKEKPDMQDRDHTNANSASERKAEDVAEATIQ
jgi:hypothetical protein